MEAFSALPYYESSRLEFTPRHTHTCTMGAVMQHQHLTLMCVHCGIVALSTQSWGRVIYAALSHSSKCLTMVACWVFFFFVIIKEVTKSRKDFSIVLQVLLHWCWVLELLFVTVNVLWLTVCPDGYKRRRAFYTELSGVGQFSTLTCSRSNLQMIKKQTIRSQKWAVHNRCVLVWNTRLRPQHH